METVCPGIRDRRKELIIEVAPGTEREKQLRRDQVPVDCVKNEAGEHPPNAG